LPKAEQADLYDPELPAQYRDLLRRTPGPAQENIPLAFLAAADDAVGQGEIPKALRFIDRAADGFARGKNPVGEATALSRRALLLLNLGRESEGRDQIREAGQKWPVPPLKAFGAYLTGHFALFKGDYPVALEALKVALRENEDFRGDPYLLRLRRDTELEAGIVSLLADRVPGEPAALIPVVPSGANSPPSGLAEIGRALDLNRELLASRIAPLIPAADFQKAEAEANNFLGLAAGRRGDLDGAFRYLDRAGELSRRAGFAVGEIRSRIFRAELGLRGEWNGEGRKAAEELRRTADRRGASPYRIWARILQARYEEKEGKRREAIASLREAALIMEARRSLPGVEMVGEFCPCRGRGVHETLVTLLAAEGMAPEALRAAETSKSLATVRMLSGQDIGRTPAESDLLRQEALLDGEIERLQRSILLISGESAIDGLLARLADAEEAYRTLRGRIAAEEPRLSSLTAVHGVDPRVLQGLLDENTSLFDYFVTGEALYVWAVHRDQVHLERIELTRPEMRTLVFSFLDALRDRDKRKTDLLARKAYDLLLKPIIPFVSGERIGFISDDALTYLPFAALRYRGRYLAEGFSLFHLPEASLLQEVPASRTQTSGMRILAFGNPDLENETLDLARAPQEVERIRKRIAGTKVLLRQEATEEKAEDMAEGYDILHFAVRGQFIPDDPLNSALLLTPDAGDDGRLTAREIFSLRFGGRAVVMSGCDPMPQRDPEGRGLAALQRAFLSAGSPSVVSTLWLNDDKGVAHLLDLFYRQLAKKAPITDALRTAQLNLLREGYLPHVWAAFIVTGKY